MLSRKKPAADPAPSPASSPAPGPGSTPEPGPRAGAKNRPTPKRKEREAANRRPLVPATKGATADQKARQKQARARAREGMLSGDERFLGARDRGPVRRYLRDTVDARWNIGEVLLPAMLVILALSFVQAPWARLGVFVVAYGLIIVGVLDAVLLWRRTRGKVVEHFGEEPGRGSATYVILRAFQMRMSRVPRPQVARGDQVRPRRT
ncbi:DUF3043 domain-containing protein [Ornithinicoccus halotolerans]|uniref:DUF3043 domain-containing protein n=1 Tax=Ornithinicoccus halotolerans TaxID=1748220 RepID=UPI001E310BE0|nr:DUF3043 domain-containing protein [Ornithinicoccus halotolerans]